MTEVRFYHLTDTPLEAVLPIMLARTIDRGGRAVVRSDLAERLAFLNTHLWTHDSAGFLPHGMDGDPEPNLQPVWLTTNTASPNGASTVFLLDAAPYEPSDAHDLDVLAILFDGHDPAAVDRARGQWRSTTQAGLRAVYWAQRDGRWVKAHESG